MILILGLHFTILFFRNWLVQENQINPWTRYFWKVSRYIRSEKSQNESSPNFSNFRPEFCSEFSPIFLRSFRASFRGKRRPEKFHQKSPPFFNANFPGKYEKIFTKIFWRGGNVTIHLPFLSRYFCKSMPSSWQKVVYTPPICITIRLPSVSRCFCRSVRVRGRWDTPN